MTATGNDRHSGSWVRTVAVVPVATHIPCHSLCVNGGVLTQKVSKGWEKSLLAALIHWARLKFALN